MLTQKNQRLSIYTKGVVMKNILFVLIAVCLIISACEKSTKQLDPVAQPTFLPIGGNYYSPQSVRISCSTNNAIIRYTLNGTDPSSTSQIYSTEIGIANNTTIKAQAYKANMSASQIATASYNFGVGNMYINPPSGTYPAPQSVVITPTTQGTIVHYTTDGSVPSESSPIYTAPIIIDKYTVLKVKGYVAGWTSSAIDSATYHFNVAQPTFSETEGLHYNALSVILSSTTDGAAIRYTTNGSEPTESSTLYENPITVAASMTIKAKAYKALWNASSIASANYELKVTSPTFNPLPTTFNTPQTVTIACTTPNASIYYTTNGQEPLTTDQHYTNPVVISSISTLKAKAYVTGWTPSNITSGIYNFDVATPSFSPVAGSYQDPQTVSIACVTPSAEIRYTTDNTEPTSTSSLYSAPILISTTTTLKARGFRTGMNSSQSFAATYTISPIQTVATPTFNPQGGTFNSIINVAISCATSGATIRYTVNNSEPTTASASYTGPVSIAATSTLKAKAFKTGWYDSQTTSDIYTINFDPHEMINFAGGSFTMGRTTGSGNTEELPTHPVTLSAFSIGKYEVMQSDWITIMQSNPSYFQGNLYKPVENINWYRVLAYCNKRSISEGLTPTYTILNSTDPDDWGAIPIAINPDWDAAICNFTVNGYRLPTEAEWEYAARGGTNNPDFLYSGSNTVADVAWYQTNSSGTTHPVGQLQGNGMSIFDMSGNVNEWCWDWYDAQYYSVSPANNPTGPSTGVTHIIRGGSYDQFVSQYCRVVSRSSAGPHARSSNTGLRVARTITQ